MIPAARLIRCRCGIEVVDSFVGVSSISIASWWRDPVDFLDRPNLPASPVLGHRHEPIKHDGTQTDGIAGRSAGATGRGSVRHGRPLAALQHVAQPLRSVAVVAVRRSEVAPAAPEEPGDQEHPEEHPDQPRGAEDDGSNDSANHQKRREPEYG